MVSIFYSLVAIILLMLTPLASAYKTVQFVSEFGGKGESLGKFSIENRLAFDKNGNIYVVDTDNMCVQKLSPDGMPVMEIVSGTEFLFTRPMDVTVDGELNIYIADWKPVHIHGTDSPKIFNYGPCIYKFSQDGKYLATFTLEDLTKKAAEKESAVPAVDTDGNFALMIIPEKPDRMIYISADNDGNVYVLDQKTISKLNSSGESLLRFAGPGQLDDPTGMDVDSEGNVYVSDSGNHRILKFSPDGKLLLSFGKEGDADSQFMKDLYIAVGYDDNIFVADSAKYEKTFKTALKHRKIIDSTILVTGQDDPLIPRRRDFETVMRRFQKFDKNGRFLEKFFYRIDKSDPELRDLEFKAIDPGGNLYLIDKDRLVILKYSIQKPVQWSLVDKSFTFQFQRSMNRSQIDNFYDLDASFDFDEREKFTQMISIARLSYDMTETFNISMTGSLTRIYGLTYDNYPGDADPHGYIQDDETKDRYTAARIRIDLSLILDHDPFKYRVGNLFAFLGSGDYDFNIRATDPTFQNRRRLDENLWWAVWAAGMSYDMGTDLRLSFIAAQRKPPGFMNYDYEYWNEEGMLYATGLWSVVSTEVFISVDGAF